MDHQSGSQQSAGPPSKQDSFTEDRIRMQQGGEISLVMEACAAASH